MGITQWKKLGEKILGKNYNLSVVVASDALMKKLNRKYRQKNKSTNVLSFGLEKNIGEIFINTERATKEARKLKLPESDYLEYLLLHSILHLKGYDHGASMENEEAKIIKKLNLKLEVNKLEVEN